MARRYCPVEEGGCGHTMRKTAHGGYECNNPDCKVFSARFDRKGRLLKVTYVGVTPLYTGAGGFKLTP